MDDEFRKYYLEVKPKGLIKLAITTVEKSDWLTDCKLTLVQPLLVAAQTDD